MTGHLLGISLALLQAEPLFVFQFLIKEEKRRLCLNCVKSFKSSQQPKLLYSQSFFFLLSNWFFECEHQFIDNQWS